MPRFYFDITDSSGFHPDEFSEELPGFAEAREQAQVLLPDIVREQLPDGDLHTVSCNVRDENDRVVYRATITFQGTRDP